MDYSFIIIIGLVVLIIIILLISAGVIMTILSQQHGQQHQQFRDNRERELDREAQERLAGIPNQPALPEPKHDVEFAPPQPYQPEPVSRQPNSDIVFGGADEVSSKTQPIDFGSSEELPPNPSPSSPIKSSDTLSIYKCPVDRRVIIAQEYNRGLLYRCQNCGTIYHKECKEEYGHVCQCGGRVWDAV